MCYFINAAQDTFHHLTNYLQQAHKNSAFFHKLLSWILKYTLLDGKAARKKKHTKIPENAIYHF